MRSAASPTIDQQNSTAKIRRLQLTKEEFRASIPQSTCPKRFAISRQKRQETTTSEVSRNIDSLSIEQAYSSAKIHRRRLTKEEFRASIPQSTRPKRFGLSNQKRLEKTSAARRRSLNPPSVYSCNDDNYHYQHEIALEQDDHQSRTSVPSIALDEHGNEKVLVFMERFLNDRTEDTISLEERADPKPRLPVDATSNLFTPKTPVTLLYIKPRLAQLKKCPDAYDAPQDDPESLDSQAQVSQNKHDTEPYFGDGVCNNIGHTSHKADSLELHKEEQDSRTPNQGHLTCQIESSVFSAKPRRDLAQQEATEERRGSEIATSPESLDDIKQELLGLHQNKGKIYNTAEDCSSTFKRPWTHDNGELSTSYGFQRPMSDTNRRDDDELDNSPPKKRHTRRQASKSDIRDVTLRELTAKRASKPLRKQNDGKKINKRGITKSPRRLPDLGAELIFLPEKLDGFNFGHLAEELSDDPIDYDEETFDTEHELTRPIITFRLQPTIRKQTRLQISDDIFCWKPKSLSSLRCSKTSMKSLISHCDGFEGKEALPSGRFMPVRTQRKYHERQRRVLSYFPPLVLVTEMPMTKGELVSSVGISPSRRSSHPSNENVPMLMDYQPDLHSSDEDMLILVGGQPAQQFIEQPLASVSSDEINNAVSLPRKFFKTPETFDLRLSYRNETQSGRTGSSPLKRKLRRDQHRSTGSRDLVVPKQRRTSGLPLRLSLHPDKTMRPTQQSEPVSINRPVFKRPRLELNDLQVSQELTPVSMQRTFSHIQSESASNRSESESEDEDISEGSHGKLKSGYKISKDEKIVSGNILAPREVCLQGPRELHEEVPESIVITLQQENTADIQFQEKDDCRAPLSNHFNIQDGDRLEINQDPIPKECNSELGVEDVNTRGETDSNTNQDSVVEKYNIEPTCGDAYVARVKDDSQNDQDLRAKITDRGFSVVKNEAITIDDVQTQIGNEEMPNKSKVGLSKRISFPILGYEPAPTSSKQLWGCINSSAVSQTPPPLHRPSLVPLHITHNQNPTQEINPDSPWKPRPPRSSGISIEVDEEIEDSSSPIYTRSKAKSDHCNAVQDIQNPQSFSQPWSLVNCVLTNLVNGISVSQPEQSWKHSSPSKAGSQNAQGDSQGSTFSGSLDQERKSLYHVIHRLPPKDPTGAHLTDELEVPKTQELYAEETNYLAQASQVLAKSTFSRAMPMPMTLQQKLGAVSVLAVGGISLSQAFDHTLGSISPKRTPQLLPSILDSCLIQSKSLESLTQKVSQDMGTLPPSAAVINRQRTRSICLPPPFLKPAKHSGI